MLFLQPYSIIYNNVISFTLKREQWQDAKFIHGDYIYIQLQIPPNKIKLTSFQLLDA